MGTDHAVIAPGSMYSVVIAAAQLASGGVL
jgi:hypothetical protein